MIVFRTAAHRADDLDSVAIFFIPERTFFQQTTVRLRGILSEPLYSQMFEVNKAE